MHYGSNNQRAKYVMNRLELKEAVSERNLGVLFSADSMWFEGQSYAWDGLKAV